MSRRENAQPGSETQVGPFDRPTSGLLVRSGKDASADMYKAHEPTRYSAQEAGRNTTARGTGSNSCDCSISPNGQFVNSLAREKSSQWDIYMMCKANIPINSTVTVKASPDKFVIYPPSRRHHPPPHRDGRPCSNRYLTSSQI